LGRTCWIDFRSGLAAKRRPHSQNWDGNSVRWIVMRGACFVIRGASGRVTCDWASCQFCAGRIRFTRVGDCVSGPRFGLGAMETWRRISRCPDGMRAAPTPRAWGRYAGPRGRICPPFSGGQIPCPWKAVWLLGETKAFLGEPEGPMPSAADVCEAVYGGQGNGWFCGKGRTKKRAVGRWLAGDSGRLSRVLGRPYRRSRMGVRIGWFALCGPTSEIGQMGPAALLLTSSGGAAAFQNRLGRR
jgi:hypothetical protein